MTDASVHDPAGRTVLPCIEDPDLFFSELPHDWREARQLCYGCHNREPCLQRALDQRERWGVWGGQVIQFGVIISTELVPVATERDRLLALIAALADPEDRVLEGWRPEQLQEAYVTHFHAPMDELRLKENLAALANARCIRITVRQAMRDYLVRREPPEAHRLQIAPAVRVKKPVPPRAGSDSTGNRGNVLPEVPPDPDPIQGEDLDGYLYLVRSDPLRPPAPQPPRVQAVDPARAALILIPLAQAGGESGDPTVPQLAATLGISESMMHMVCQKMDAERLMQRHTVRTQGMAVTVRRLTYEGLVWLGTYSPDTLRDLPERKRLSA